jgi:hypothetical protein
MIAETGRSWQEAVLGVRAILPAMLAAVPIGVLFGALSTGKGLSVAEVGLMSAWSLPAGHNLPPSKFGGHRRPLLFSRFPLC